MPRWVIGPAPGNENGWAFCESDAPTPHEVQATWISWDGFEWHSCKSFRYVPKEDEMDGLDSDEDFMDDEEEWDDGKAFGSLDLSSQEAGGDEQQGVKVQMSLDEYEAMKTDRQNNYDEQKKEKDKEIVVMESLAEEADPSHAANGGAPATEEPAPTEEGGVPEGGKGGKKKSKSKSKDKKGADEGGTDRGEKKKGGMFKRK